MALEIAGGSAWAVVTIDGSVAKSGAISLGHLYQNTYRVVANRGRRIKSMAQ